MRAVTPPLNIAQLNRRLADIAREQRVTIARVRLMLCTLVVSQMLPDAVAIKGGMGIKLRMGERGTRATADLDVSTRDRGASFEEEFRARLAHGWGAVPASTRALRANPEAPDRVAFTGALRLGRVHDPGLARPQYVMHPHRVTLSFLGREWAGLDVEVSDPEIEPRAHSRRSIDGELAELGAVFGFGELRPVELIDLEHQIAQKIHAVTDPDFVRAHDLEFRRAQQWPPLPLRPMDDWGVAYDEARQETEVDGSTPVLVDIAVAREWLERVITEIESRAST